MVVKRSKHLENIYQSLENLEQYFTSVKCEKASDRVMSFVESTLLKVESELKLTTSNYRPTKQDK